ALTTGSAVLTATSEGKSGSADVLVAAPPPVASVTVTPSTDTVVVGDSTLFFATLRDAQGKELSGRAVTWTISDSSVARIQSSNSQWARIRALKPGSSVLTATSEAKSGTAQVVVIAPPPVASVTVTP